MDLANPDCQHCDSKLKPLFQGFFCPNDLCYSNRGRPEFEAAHKRKMVAVIGTLIDNWKCPRCDRRYGVQGYCMVCQGCIPLDPVNNTPLIKNWRDNYYHKFMIVCLNCCADNQRGNKHCIKCSITFN